LRARLLCEQLGQSQLLARVLAYQVVVHWSVKNFANARECTEQLQALAASTTDEITRFFAGFAAGVLGYLSGDYVSARDYLEQALMLSDDTRRLLTQDPNSAAAFVHATGVVGISL
jgi:hypothetical protein